MRVEAVELKSTDVREGVKDKGSLEAPENLKELQPQKSNLDNPFYPVGFDAMIAKIRSAIGKEP